MQCWRTRKHISMVPLGGPLAFAGCALVPAIGWKVGLAALAADPVTFAVIVAVSSA